MPAENATLFADWPPTPEPRPSPAAAAPPDAPPRFQFINRNQIFLRTIDVEALIGEDHAARVIWNVIDKLDLSAFSQNARAVKGFAGRAAIDPRLLVSLWIYAYSQGVASGRQIASLCTYHPAYQWLTGATQISGHSLSDFRVDHKLALEKLFIDVVGVLSSEGFVKLTRVMQDGVKVRANAAADSMRRRASLEEHLEQARQQCAALAEQEASEESEVQIQARQRGAQSRAERVAAALEQIQQLEAKSDAEKVVRVSSSDPEARNMRHTDGAFAPSYNVQTTTSATGKAIVSLEVTQDGNDFEQLTPALDRVQRTLGSQPQEAVADGGYITQKNLVETATRGVELIGPVPTTEAKAAQCYARSGVQKEYYAEQFRFEAGENCMYCPQGVRMNYQGKTKSDLVVIHKYQARAQDCAACVAKADCCPKNAKSGRSVQRSEYHAEIQAFQQSMATPEKQEIYRQRSEVAETPHLWLKAKFGLRQFHVRGLVKVGQEALWAALTYNVVLLIRYRKQAARV